MKSIKEIRNEANAIYGRSSHYITGTFLVITTIVTIAKSVLNLIGVEIGMGNLFLAAALFSPMEYGMVKASLLAYEHKAKEVKTKETSLEGIKKYPSIMIPFIGRTIIVYAIEAIVLACFVLASTNSLRDLSTALNVVLSGNFASIFQDGVITMVVGSILGIIVTLIVGFVVDTYFSLSYFYVVEDNLSLMDSLQASARSMKGRFASFILLRVSYLPYAIVTAIVVNIFSVALTTMFQQLLTILPTVPVFAFNLLLTIIVGFISALVSIMIYKVKETLAITVFYKEVRK